MPASIFRPLGKREVLQTQSAGANSERIANSSDTLHTALTETGARFAAGAQPGTIRLLDVFPLRSPISISYKVSLYGPAQIDCQGFAITLNGPVVLQNFSLINCGGIVVNSENVVMRQITISAGNACPGILVNNAYAVIDDVTMTTGTATFTSSISLNNGSYTVINRVVSNSPILVDVVLSSSEVRIIDCISATATVNFDGQLWVVRGNRIGNITGSVVSGSSVISGKVMNGANIDTSAGLGSNTIFGNTNCGTITPDTTDAVGLNT